MRCHMCQKEQVYVCESTKSVEKSIKEIKSKIVEDGWLPNRHLCQACSKPISFKKTEMKDKFTKRQIIHRASLLGASKKKYPPFSEEENEIITRAYSTQKNPLQFLLNKTILGVTRRGYSIPQQA